MKRKMVTVDGCTACAHVVHATNEIITIYPITPSSPIAEICDAKSAAGQRNIWGAVPMVTEMQSEAGVAGAVHGSLTTGAVSTTISASQGLLLIIPAMYRISGELYATVFHVTARALAVQGLCIFGDHSDVMAARATGFGFLCSASVQEAMDFALIAQAATLESRVPFLHFFDGFRTSHEIQKIEELTADDMRAMIDEELVLAHRMRGLSPDRPAIRGTAQNPDVYFQGRERVNPFYEQAPGIVQKAMDKFAGIVGRHYHLFDYYGSPDAENVIVVMGSAAEVVAGTVDYLNRRGGRLGLVQVRLFRPFSVDAFARALPRSVRKIAVLDRTKEPGAIGEPLYIDVRTAVGEAMEADSPFESYPVVVGQIGVSGDNNLLAAVESLQNLDVIVIGQANGDSFQSGGAVAHGEDVALAILLHERPPGDEQGIVLLSSHDPDLQEHARPQLVLGVLRRDLGAEAAAAGIAGRGNAGDDAGKLGLGKGRHDTHDRLPDSDVLHLVLLDRDEDVDIGAHNAHDGCCGAGLGSR